MTKLSARWFTALAALALGAGTLARAEEPSADASLLRRLEALEAANRELSHRYRDLERRYEDLRERVGGGEESAPGVANEPRARPGVAMPEGWSESVRSESSGRSESRGRSESDPEFESGGNAYRSPLRARFEDGFVLESPDEELTLRLHVLSQSDAKFFTPNNQFPARSGLYIPRVRVYFEGRLSRPVQYEVSLQRSVEGVWDLLDANLDTRFSEAFQVQFGRMLVPYSYDWFDHLEQYFITPERGLFPLNFGLSRSAGLMAHGWLLDRRVQYAIGGFDARLSALADNNTVRDAVGYLNLRPFLHSERFPALRHLNVGGSIFGGRQIVPEDPLPLRTSIQSSENDEAAEAASAVFLRFAEGVGALGDRSAGALHLAYYYRGLSLEAEWQRGRFSYSRRELPAPVAVPVTGYHVTMGYFLTGETVEGRTTVAPLRPFRPGRPGSGPGAVELFARYSQLDLGEQVFSAGLADPLESTRRVDMVDLGFNWYPSSFVKFYVDWQLPFYGSPVLVNRGTDTYSSQAALFWVRCQFYY